MHHFKLMKNYKEAFLCQNLQGRIEFAFDCHDSETDSGSVFSIIVDGDTVFPAEAPENEGCDGIDDASGCNGFDVSDVEKAMDEYRQLTPEQALHTENLLLQAFAVLDRRMNQKALEKLAEYYSFLPKILHPVCELRFAASEILPDNKSMILLSADSDIELYAADREILEDFDGLLAEFCHDTCFGVSDFVSYVKKKKGVSSIWFVKYAGVYPKVCAEYKDLFWHNF